MHSSHTGLLVAIFKSQLFEQTSVYFQANVVGCLVTGMLQELLQLHDLFTRKTSSIPVNNMSFLGIFQVPPVLSQKNPKMQKKCVI